MFRKPTIALLCAFLMFTPKCTVTYKLKPGRVKASVEHLNYIRLLYGWKDMTGIKIKDKNQQVFTVDQITGTTVDEQNLSDKIEQFSLLLGCRYVHRLKSLWDVLNGFENRCQIHMTEPTNVNFVICVMLLFLSIKQPSRVLDMLNYMAKGLVLVQKLPKTITLYYGKKNLTTINRFKFQLKKINNISPPPTFVSENETVNEQESKVVNEAISDAIYSLKFIADVTNFSCIYEQPIVTFGLLSEEFDSLQDKTPYFNNLYAYVNIKIGLFCETVIQNDFGNLGLNMLESVVLQSGTTMLASLKEP